MGLIIGGVGLLLVCCAVGCFAAALWADRRLMVMRSAETISAADTGRLHRAGVRGQRCEVTGTIECDNPMSAPLSGTLCVAYTHQSVKRVQGGVYSDLQDGGKYNHDYTEIDPSRERRTRFYVRDASGRVLIDPAWASIEMPRTKEQYDSTTSGADSQRAETVGAWQIEEALSLGQQVYVLGYLGEFAGEPALVCHPSDRSEPFLISHRSERELARTATTRSNAFYLAGGATGVLGVLGVLLAVLRFGLL